MASSININQNNNDITLQDNNRSISITDNNTGTTINVTQPVTNVVTVATLGPQGPQGPQGPIGPIPTSGSFTGSFSGSFTGSLQGTASYALTASYLQGYISPFPFTGSARITGSLGVTGSISTTTGFLHNRSLNSDNRALYDIYGINSIIWDSRALINLNSSETLNWTDSDNITGITTIPISEQLSQQRINDQLASKLLIANGKIVTGQTIEQDARISGTIVYYNGDVTEWQRLENSVIINSENPINNILGIVIDQQSRSILLQGNITFEVTNGGASSEGYPPVQGQFRDGDPLYLYYSEGGGYTGPVAFSAEIPDGAVRSMGHILQSVISDDNLLINGIISFNPSNDYSRILSGTDKIYQINGKDIYALSSSLAISSSFASTASFLNTLNQNLTFNGNLTLNGTASIGTLVVNQTVLSTGSNQLGDAANDTQTLYGTVVIPTGSLTVTGSFNTRAFGSTNFGYSTRIVSQSNQNIFVSGVGWMPLWTTGSLIGEYLTDGGYQYANGMFSGSVLLTGLGDLPIRVRQSGIFQTSGSDLLGISVTDSDSTSIGGTKTIQAQIQGTLTSGSSNEQYSFNINKVPSLNTIDLNIRKDNNIGDSIYLNLNDGSTGFSLYNTLPLTDPTYLFKVYRSSNATYGGDGSPIFTIFQNRIESNIPITGSFTGSFTGSVAAPGSNNQIVYNNGGVLGANSGFVYSGSRIGIGTTSPSQSLDLRGSMQISGSIFPFADSVSYLGDTALRFTQVYTRGLSAVGNSLDIVGANINLNDSAGNVLARVTGATGNVGIGMSTTAPTSRLQVRGSGTTSATTAFRVDNTNASASLTITDDGASTFTAQSNATPITITGYVATGSALQPALDITGSWNTAGAPTAIKLNVNNISSSANSLLIDLQTTGSSQFRVNRSGKVESNGYNVFNSNTGFAGIYGPISGFSGTLVNIVSNVFPSQTGTDIEFANSQGTPIITSGTRNFIRLYLNFSPTSGNGIVNQILLNPTINQTGGANGITRGLYLQPTLTSAADFRAIESTNGKVILTDTYSASGSLAGSILDISQTWNTPGVVTGIKYNVTNTTSSANSLLMDLQVGGTSRFRAINNGSVISLLAYYVGPQISSTAGISAFNPRNNTSILTSNFNVGVRLGDFRDILSEGYSYLISSPQYTDLTYTGSIGGFVTIARGYAPTSGTGVFNVLSLENTINQTGGANGITRGLLISPTLTAAADWRSIEFNNNTGWGIYGVGGATNYLSGSLGIRTTAPSYSLDVSGSTYSRRVLVGNDSGSSAVNDFYHRGTNGGVYFVIRDSNNNNRLYFTGQSGTSQMVAVSQNIGLGVATLTSTNRVTIGGTGATSATTALRVENSNTSASLIITDDLNSQFFGNVGIRRTATASLDIAGTTRISGSFNTAISGSILTVQGSGSAQPIFTVQGSQGELFSITDSLSGSLFSVNDISGLPILEVFSDNTTLIGNYQDPMLITTAKVVQTNSGSFTVYSLPTASYDTAFFEYSIRSSSNARAGTIMAIQSGSAVNFTETTTTSFGSTSAVSFTVIVTGSNMALTGSSTTGSWTIKTIVRGL
jgi:hypothetical protein